MNDKFFSQIYDSFIARSDISNKKINNHILKILKHHHVKSIGDSSCGTGNQSIFFARKGFRVISSDINPYIVKIAKKKSKNLKIEWKTGNMIKLNFKGVDSIISIYNSILHLDNREIIEGFKNFYDNLNSGGVLIFDVFNETFLRKNIAHHKFIQNVFEVNKKRYVLLNEVSKIDKTGLMVSNFKLYFQKGFHERKEFSFKICQFICSRGEIVNLLKKTGFKKIETYDPKGGRFNKKKSVFLLVVAKK